MLMRKLILVGLIATSASNMHAASTHEIRTWGIMGAGLILTSMGAHLIYRYQNDFSHRLFDTILGVALIAAGVSGIVASDKVIQVIERAFR